jgi:arsenical pump membrane protein
LPVSVQEVVALAALATVLAFAVARPRGYPEAVAAVPAAVAVVVTGGLSVEDAAHQIVTLLPVMVFLVALLVIGEVSDAEGLFTALGSQLGHACGGEPNRLLRHVFVVASATTAVLGLDATAVLLTPVVLATARQVHVRARPHAYACAHLANSASLLLPVSNLTNLLAFRASGLSFVSFGLVMALPWMVVIAVEYAVFRWFFHGDLRAPVNRPSAPALGVPIPIFPVVVVCTVLVGFGLAQPTGLDPVLFAVTGAAVLATHGLARRTLRPGRLFHAAALDFVVFVLALGVVVRAVAAGGLGRAIGEVLPSGVSYLALLTIAVVAALLANLVNNLPALLLLLPLLDHAGTGAVMAALVGVNVGPNLTYIGSLATLLWRRVLRHSGAEPALPAFLLLGALTVPLALALGVAALCCSLAVLSP